MMALFGLTRDEVIEAIRENLSNASIDSLYNICGHLRNVKGWHMRSLHETLKESGDSDDLVMVCSLLANADALCRGSVKIKPASYAYSDQAKRFYFDLKGESLEVGPQKLTVNLNAQTVELDALFGGYAYHGHITLFGQYHHIRCIRMKDEGEMIEPDDKAPQDVKEWFHDGQKLYDGAYTPVTLPDVKGRYVVFIFPFAD
jgi:hypothetical protein